MTNKTQVELAVLFATAKCECGHGILAFHVDKCNWSVDPDADPSVRLRQAIFGPECECDKSDAECLAEIVEPMLAGSGA